MNFRLTPPLFSIFLKDQNIKKWSRYYIFLKILRLKKVVTLLCTFGQVKKSGHNFLKTYILKNQPQLFKKHTYFEIRKTSLSKKNKKAMQTLRWTPPHIDKHEQFGNPLPPQAATQFMDIPSPSSKKNYQRTVYLWDCLTVHMHQVHNLRDNLLFLVQVRYQ